MSQERDPIQHDLKSHPEPFHQVRVGLKNFEIRVNDRDYREGDTVLLKEYDPTSKTFSGLREGPFTIGTVIPGGAWGLPDNVCVFALLWNPEGDAEHAAVAEVKDNPDDIGTYIDNLTDSAFPVGMKLYASPYHAAVDGVLTAAIDALSVRCGFPVCLDRIQALDTIGKKVERLTGIERLVNTPKTDEFFTAVRNEAAHQVVRWGEDHDLKKTPSEWISLMVHLLGKTVKAQWAGDREKYLHHIITGAAVCLNWHRQVLAKWKKPESA